MSGYRRDRLAVRPSLSGARTSHQPVAPRVATWLFAVVLCYQPGVDLYLARPPGPDPLRSPLVTTTDVVPLPPTAVRAAFALFLGVVVLSLLNAVVQVAFQLSGTTVLVGALIETGLFILLGTRMRAGRLWARVALMSVAWVFVAVSLLAVFGLNGAFAHNVNGLVVFTLIYVAAKLGMIVAATLLMYRPSTRGYFH